MKIKSERRPSGRRGRLIPDEEIHQTRGDELPIDLVIIVDRVIALPNHKAFVCLARKDDAWELNLAPTGTQKEKATP